jgi:putative thioredoxin
LECVLGSAIHYDARRRGLAQRMQDHLRQCSLPLPPGLRRLVAEAPEDLSARFELAKAHIATGDFEGAVEHLLFIIKQDRAWQDDAARKQLLKVFDAAGPMAEVTRQGRRKLSAILFS